MGKCIKCSKPAGFALSICPECERTRVASFDAQFAPEPPASTPPLDRRFVFSGIGLIVGAAIGFLTRPSAFLIGQLPFSTVISRGGTLSGMDELLVPTAQGSSNQMLFFAVLGAALGFGVPFALRLAKDAQSGAAHSAARNDGPSAFPHPAADAELLNNDAVLQMIAVGLGEDIILEKIKYSRCAFALSSSDLAQLKQSGASDRILTGMLQNQAQRGEVL